MRQETITRRRYDAVEDRRDVLKAYAGAGARLLVMPRLSPGCRRQDVRVAQASLRVRRTRASTSTPRPWKFTTTGVAETGRPSLNKGRSRHRMCRVKRSKNCLAMLDKVPEKIRDRGPQQQGRPATTIPNYKQMMAPKSGKPGGTAARPPRSTPPSAISTRCSPH